eukprot:EG_transcript_9941
MLKFVWLQTNRCAWVSSFSRRLASFQREAATHLLQDMASKTETMVLTQHDSLKVIGTFGLGLLQHYVHKVGAPTDDLASKVPPVSAVKAILKQADGSLATHNTGCQATELAVSRNRAQEIVDLFIKRFENTELRLEGLVFSEWLNYEPKMGNEIQLSAYQDPVFGPCVVVAFGGVLASAYKDELKLRPVVIPVVYGIDSFLPVLKASMLVKFLTGQLRGTQPLCEWEQLERATRAMAEGIVHFSAYNAEAPFIIDEIEVNPVAVADGRLVALDSVLKVSPNKATVLLSKPITKLGVMLQPKSMGLLGVSDKVTGKTVATKAVGAAFKWFAKTSLANVLLESVMKSSTFQGKEPAAKVGLSQAVNDFFQDALVPQQNLNPCNSILAGARDQQGVALYPIHRTASFIQGFPCVTSLEAMKGRNGGRPVDVLVVAAPAPAAVRALEECIANRYCETVLLHSAGFAETGSGRLLWAELPEALGKLPPKERPLINGPNTAGNWVSGAKAFNTMFADDPRAMAM